MNEQNFTVYVAEKSQLDAQNQILTEINAKLPTIDLSQVEPLILDFVNDPVVIISGGLDSYRRRITN